VLALVCAPAAGEHFAVGPDQMRSPSLRPDACVFASFDAGRPRGGAERDAARAPDPGPARARSLERAVRGDRGGRREARRARGGGGPRRGATTGVPTGGPRRPARRLAGLPRLLLRRRHAVTFDGARRRRAAGSRRPPRSLMLSKLAALACTARRLDPEPKGPLEGFWPSMLTSQPAVFRSRSRQCMWGLSVQSAGPVRRGRGTNNDGRSI
jgi:hypothetical protein